MSGKDGGLVTVEILGRRYPIRSSLNPAYVNELAAYVDQKMQTVAEDTAGVDAVRVAVLAALNIADEYFRLRRAADNPPDPAVTDELEQLVDRALEALPAATDADRAAHG